MKNPKKLINKLHTLNVTSTTILLRLVLVVFALASHSMAFSQLQIHPLPAPHYAVTSSANQRIQSDSILALPFWEDFTTNSKDEDGNPIPNQNLWQNSLSVKINNSMAYNQPTINVATFDGLDSVNNAYNANALVSDISDKMESGQFDLSSYKSSDNRDSIYLSFFYQWKGKGEAPDKNDYLQLQFMDSVSRWNVIKTYYPGEDLDQTKFTYAMEQVDKSFQHDHFRFRIVRNGKNTGPYDTWNVDYIYLAKGRKIEDGPYVKDRALASEISPLFGNYRAIPLKHLRNLKDDFLSSVKFVINNLAAGEVNLSVKQKRGATLRSTLHYENSNTINEEVVDISVPALLNGDFAGRLNCNLFFDSIRYNESKWFDTLAESIDLRLKFYIDSKDFDTGMETYYKVHFGPFNLRRNDTLTADYHLSDYYAHDDGEAEYAAIVQDKGNRAVQRFDLLQADTMLTGVDVYFPYYGSSTTLTTRIVIYDMGQDSLPGKSVFRRVISVPKSTLNKFTRITFSKRAVSKSIFVGWEEQSATDPVRVGIDYSNYLPNITYEYKNTVWQKTERVKGSLMVRPVFGYDTTIIAGVETEPLTILVYPNPNEGTFTIKGQYDTLKVINLTGQSIPFSEEQLAEEKRVTIQGTAGLYLLKLQYHNKITTKKILVR